MRSQLSDVVSLSERMGYFQALRAGFACIVLASALFAEEVIGASISDIALVTAAYLVVSAVAEGSRRLAGERGLSIVTLMLLIDGVYLAWMMYETGGTNSPLRFLTYIHLIAVTLLASHRTGLKIALWHSLMFFVSYYAQAARILEVREIAGMTGAEFERRSVFNVMAFWLIALGTTAFSSINERELRRRKADLESLAEMAEGIEGLTDPDEMAQLLLDKVAEELEFKRGVVLGGQNRQVSLMAFRGPGEPAAITPGVDTLVQEAWDTHKTILKKKPNPDENPRLTALLPFARNLVVVPLFAEGQPVAALALEHTRKTPRIERRVVAMLEQFASHAALNIRNAWLQEQVQRMAETDALTGVANRRVFESTLTKEMARGDRSGEQVTLVMVDVDHFKHFNDTYGHQEGDSVLRAVAAALQEASREFDVVARYGGEEFAIILPQCSAKESLVVAERLRKSISDIKAAGPVTASAGVATFPSHAADISSLIKAADEALYESKRAGRDRVTRSRRRASARPARDKVAAAPAPADTPS